MGQTIPFPYRNDHKHDYTWNYCLRHHFDQKIFKIALDGAFDCPNHDGTVAVGGCTFYSASGSGIFAGNRNHDLNMQFQEIQ